MADVVPAVAGGLVSGTLGLVGDSMTNEANASLASDANQTSIELANTAHQREVKDLTAAGLNPILSAGGSGASVPSLSVAKMENPLAAMSEAMKGAVQDWSAYKQASAVDAQIDKAKSETRLNDANALLTAAQTNSAVAATRETEARTPTYAQQIALSQAQVSNAKQNTAYSRAQQANVEREGIIQRGGLITKYSGTDLYDRVRHGIATTGNPTRSLLSVRPHSPASVLFNSAKDAAHSISKKLSDVISGISVNSGKANHRFTGSGSFLDNQVSYVGGKHVY
nr:MAG: DNA pilot protein [Microvirus sp.]